MPPVRTVESCVRIQTYRVCTLLQSRYESKWYSLNKQLSVRDEEQCVAGALTGDVTLENPFFAICHAILSRNKKCFLVALEEDVTLGNGPCNLFQTFHRNIWSGGGIEFTHDEILLAVITNRCEASCRSGVTLDSVLKLSQTCSKSFFRSELKSCTSGYESFPREWRERKESYED